MPQNHQANSGGLPEAEPSPQAERDTASERFHIRIATRTSALALWQAEYVAARLRDLPQQPVVELVRVTTTGDQNQTDALRQFGGTGVFTREVQKAVLDGRADVAVHSLKDLPTESTAGMVLAAVPARAPRCDAMLLPHTAAPLNSILDLPPGASVGTGSPRRQAQLRLHRPDLRVLEIRGNIDTRLRKLDEGQYDAILLAEAGLDRLGLAQRISVRLCPPDFYPAVSQGALGIECRDDDAATRSLLAHLTCSRTLAESLAERALLRALRAGCHAPLGVWTEAIPAGISLTGILLSTDGATCVRQSATGDAEAPEELGQHVAQLLLECGGAALLTNRADESG